MRRCATGWLLGAVLGMAAMACEHPSTTAHSDLREALLESSEELRARSIEDRLALADALLYAMDHQRELEHHEGTEPLDSPRIVAALDARRAGVGYEPLFVVALTRTPRSFSADIRTLGPSTDGDAGARAARPSLGHGPLALPHELSEEPYATALDGRAGAWIERMAVERGVRTVVLARGVPFGLLGDGEVIYANPNWIELLGLLDADARQLSSLGAGGEELGLSTSALIDGPPVIGGPVEHHRTDSSGFGCYRGGGSSSCDPVLGTCSCTCGYCGLDCGLCACETCNGAEGIHCAVRSPERSPAAPLDPLFVALPVLYVLWRRRRA